jgi:hypothetical protein
MHWNAGSRCLGDSDVHRLALDNDREIVAEIGLLLSCYAIIDLFILHIFAKVSGQTNDVADIVLGRVRGNGPRIDLIKELISASERPKKTQELELVEGLYRATTIRNQYAHAVYSQVDRSTGWRMSMWLSDGKRRRKEFKDISVEIVRQDGIYLRSVLESLFYFGSIEVVVE